MEGSERTVEWKANQKVARKLEKMLEYKTLLHKQRFKGSNNVVADSLSHDLFYLSANIHKKLPLTATQQLQASSCILPLQVTTILNMSS